MHLASFFFSNPIRHRRYRHYHHNLHRCFHCLASQKRGSASTRLDHQQQKCKISRERSPSIASSYLHYSRLAFSFTPLAPKVCSHANSLFIHTKVFSIPLIFHSISCRATMGVHALPVWCRVERHADSSRSGYRLRNDRPAL